MDDLVDHTCGVYQRNIQITEKFESMRKRLRSSRKQDDQLEVTDKIDSERQSAKSEVGTKKRQRREQYEPLEVLPIFQILRNQQRILTDLTQQCLAAPSQ